MQFTFIRHGETLSNREGILQGHLDSDLSDKGLRQAEAAAVKLKERNFAFIGCSPLKRSRHTAEIISQVLQIPVQEHPELIERNYGPWQGMAYREIRSKYRALFQEMSQWPISDHFIRNPCPEIESYREIAQRLHFLMQRLKESALLVTHAGVLSAIMLQLKHPTFHVPVFRSTGHISISASFLTEKNRETFMSLIDYEGLLSEEELKRCVPLDPQDPFVLF